MRISRKLSAIALAALTAGAISACTPPNENPSDQKVPTAETQNPDSLKVEDAEGAEGAEKKEAESTEETSTDSTSTEATDVEATDTATADDTMGVEQGATGTGVAQ
ncbi:hypothetical protein QP027_03615 [Corynebacterium breve]|uniref:Secreted protein n=1 Tax=Corynebacterium breve TaxID=3049799 RepID=A0ABY8VJW7_9CORY|nr:hypothetical protein [Corynebacterium breve]WIM68494.1 hypothetical protein QP027_03615 [Corynebacterium breve]